MINKDIVYQKFEKRIGDYDRYADAQKEMAEKLVSLIPRKKYSSILEIGSYSGLLTRKIKENIEFDRYFAVDVVSKSREYLEKIDKNIEFINCDIEDFEPNQKFDLIVSNAALQWCEDLEGIIKKLEKSLNQNGIIAVSTFSPDNLREIKEVFNVSLNYPDEAVLKTAFSGDAKILSDKIPLKFTSALDVLRHLKYTGVNSLSVSSLSYTKIKEDLKRLNDEFNNTLTYCPLYIVSWRKKE